VSLSELSEAQREFVRRAGQMARRKVAITGKFAEFVRRGDNGSACTFRFCTDCGGTIAYSHDGMPDLTAIPVGAFADPAFQPPGYSVYEARAHTWVKIVGEDIEHHD
jgi:hypothetical protein